MKIFLIGYRCSGKTSAGKQVALALNWDFIDTDALFEKMVGQSISQFVFKHGWQSFREHEKHLLQQVSDLNHDCVISCGGGIPLESDNIATMQQHGRIFWLYASPEVLHQRMIHDRKKRHQRPPLSNQALKSEIQELVKQRNPIYNRAADIQIDTENLSICEVASSIQKEIRAYEQDNKTRFSGQNTR